MTTTKNRSAWIKAGTAVEATSAREVIQQAGLDWTVQLHEMQAYVNNKVNDFESVTDYYPIENKRAVLRVNKDNNNQVIGVVGSKYKVFQNSEVFGCLDALIDSGEARYAAAGEYDGGAKVWMLLQLPNEINVATVDCALWHVGLNRSFLLLGNCDATHLFDTYQRCGTVAVVARNNHGNQLPLPILGE